MSKNKKRGREKAKPVAEENATKQARGGDRQSQLQLSPLQTYGTIATVIVAVIGFGVGWPMWILLLTVLTVPLGSLFVWMATGPDWIRRYRFLMVVYGLVALPAIYEVWVTKKMDGPMAELLNINPGPGEADLFLQNDFPAYIRKLYPERAEAHYAQATQILMCVATKRQGLKVPICDRIGDLSWEVVGKHLEAAVKTGSVDEEGVLYDYAIYLVSNDKPKEQVDEAIRNWRWHFPFSKRPDPRSVKQPQRQVKGRSSY